MLQATEYDVRAYLKWVHQVDDFRRVMHRRSLDNTSVARAFVLFLRIGIGMQLFLAIALLVYAWSADSVVATSTSTVLLLSAPIVWALLVIFPLIIAKHFIISPRQQKMRTETKRIMGEHNAVKIAVAGSYGKTTMKELLATVLSEGKRVSSTPGNKNVSTAHFQFARALEGDEEVLVVEFGEGHPGDVEAFTDVINPDIAVITGLAPAHLDQYGTLEEAGKDIFSLAERVEADSAYINDESESLRDYIKPDYISFNKDGLDGWKVSGVRIDIHGTRFVLTKAAQQIEVESKLIGEHLIGVLAATAVIARRLGLSIEQIEAGFRRTQPYEHRMQPYQLGGAWIIDDAYNGNIQGVQAGTRLLKSLAAKRKIYVTPGLVDQGSDSDAIHVKMGHLIASAEPDIVVLIRNSATNHISRGLKEAGYAGKLSVEGEPLRFYTNLEHFIAAGDIVLLQNDWTDNYQ